ncbi:MAG: hypothetical protein IKJ34_04600, partial [Mailhella sp.]|jgi:hypothetical protein|nr:hypothetical protein [Mailhella sp.]
MFPDHDGKAAKLGLYGWKNAEILADCKVGVPFSSGKEPEIVPGKRFNFRLLNRYTYGSDPM